MRSHNGLPLSAENFNHIPGDLVAVELLIKSSHVIALCGIENKCERVRRGRLVVSPPKVSPGRRDHDDSDYQHRQEGQDLRPASGALFLRLCATRLIEVREEDTWFMR